MSERSRARGQPSKRKPPRLALKFGSSLIKGYVSRYLGSRRRLSGRARAPARSHPDQHLAGTTRTPCGRFAQSGSISLSGDILAASLWLHGANGALPREFSSKTRGPPALLRPVRPALGPIRAPGPKSGPSVAWNTCSGVWRTLQRGDWVPGRGVVARGGGGAAAAPAASWDCARTLRPFCWKGHRDHIGRPLGRVAG